MKFLSNAKTYLLPTVLIIASGSANAATVISTFDTNFDGWIEIPRSQPRGSSFQSNGGNPGGYILQIDPGGGNSSLAAPSKFLGDWNLYSSVSYDHKVFRTGRFSQIGNHRISISGPGGSAIWIGPLAPNTANNWETITAPIAEENWNVQSGAWNALIANVTNFEILDLEHYFTTGTGEQEGYDNVVLTPIPEPLTILGTATAVGFGAFFKRQINKKKKDNEE